MEPHPDIFEKCYGKNGFFDGMHLDKNHYFVEPFLNTPPGRMMEFNGGNKLMWAVNDYLGLAGHPEINEAAIEAIREWGISGPMGARILTGNTDHHVQLEQELAELSLKESAQLHNFGYLGVIGTIVAMMEPEDTILIDRYSHSCIVDGAVLGQYKSNERIRPFKHNDIEDLERNLKFVRKKNKGGILIVTEGVFGMRGDLGPLKEICDIKDKYNARLFVDDAHGFGVMGPTGKGVGEHYGVQDKVDLYFSTFAKSFAAIGGFTSGDTKIIDYLRLNNKQALTSKTLPMVYVKGMLKAAELIRREPDRREKVWSIARQLQAGLKDLGYDLGCTQSPITPVHIPAGDVEMAKEMMVYMREEHDIYISVITYPIIPLGVALFRLIPTAKHTEEDVARTLSAFKAMRDKFNLNQETVAEVE
jgi:glycine C-acetyltransferase